MYCSGLVLFSEGDEDGNSEYATADDLSLVATFCSVFIVSCDGEIAGSKLFGDDVIIYSDTVSPVLVIMWSLMDALWGKKVSGFSSKVVFDETEF